MQPAKEQKIKRATKCAPVALFLILLSAVAGVAHAQPQPLPQFKDVSRMLPREHFESYGPGGGVYDVDKRKAFDVTQIHLKLMADLGMLAHEMGRFRSKLYLCRDHRLAEWDNLVRQFRQRLAPIDFNDGLLDSVFTQNSRQGDLEGQFFFKTLSQGYRPSFCRGAGGFVTGSGDAWPDLTKEAYTLMSRLESILDPQQKYTRPNAE